jgi:hypothetical protein
MGEGRSRKAAHRQNDNVTVLEASSNKICDDCGNALTLFHGFLIGCCADAKSRQGIAGKKVEGQDTLNVARNYFG